MNKKAQEQKARSLRKVISNFVGVGLGAVVIVSAYVSNVTADFIEVESFVDSIAYTVEVLEEIDEPVDENTEIESYPLRMKVESQYGEEIIELEYGISSGLITDLRQNGSYTLKVQIQKSIGWVTIASETVQLETDINASVFTVNEETSILSETATFSFDIFFQKGESITTGDFLEIQYGDFTQLFELIDGQQTITIEDLEHLNEEVIVTIYSIVDGEKQVISTRYFATSHYISSTFNLTSDNGLDAIIEHELDTTTFTDMVYKIESDGQVLAECSGNATILPFTRYNTTIPLDIVVYYQKDGQDYREVLEHYEFTTLAKPYYVVSYGQVNQELRITLTLLDPDNQYQNVLVETLEQTYEFRQIDSNDEFKIFEIQIPYTQNFTLLLETNKEVEYTIVIERIGE